VGKQRFALYQRLIALRTAEIVPRLAGSMAISAQAIGPKAVYARWQLGDGAILTIVTNLGPQTIGFDRPPGRRLFPPGDADDDVVELTGAATRVYLESGHDR